VLDVLVIVEAGTYAEEKPLVVDDGSRVFIWAAAYTAVDGDGDAAATADEAKQHGLAVSVEGKQLRANSSTHLGLAPAPATPTGTSLTPSVLWSCAFPSAETQR
jgi:hypothetical protein